MHGGVEKAIYHYPREHYTACEALLETGSLAPGSFGENITSEGLLKPNLNIGGVLQIGTAALQVLQPRSPCYKLQIRLGRSDMAALCFQQGKPGWYASVLQEGFFAAGDEVLVSQLASERVTVADVWRYSAQLKADSAMKKRIADFELLPEFGRAGCSAVFLANELNLQPALIRNDTMS